MADDLDGLVSGEDWSGLLPTAKTVRGTLLPVMEKLGIDPGAREAIIEVAIKETVTRDEWVINACRHKGKNGMTRLQTRRLICDIFIMDLMSVLNRFEDGKLPFQGNA